MSEMKYRGFVIRQIERTAPDLKVHRSHGIYYKDKMMSPVSDMALAKRVIDEKLRTGLWKTDEE